MSTILSNVALTFLFHSLSFSIGNGSSLYGAPVQPSDWLMILPLSALNLQYYLSNLKNIIWAKEKRLGCMTIRGLLANQCPNGPWGPIHAHVSVLLSS